MSASRRKKPEPAFDGALDLKARRVVMSALLYYRYDSPVLSDGVYDALVKEVVERFDELAPIRQWQFESAEALHATTFHVKVTTAAHYGALAWHEKVHGGLPADAEDKYPRTWKLHKKFGHWCRAGA